MTSIIPSILPSIFPSIEGSILSPFGAPSLMLDFARNAYSMGAIGSVPSDRTFANLITFSRLSGGGRVNPAGQLEWVGNDVPRFTYDPVTLQPLGLLVEEQRTNLLLRSTLDGGTAGTVGSGAVAPTGWSFPFAGGTVAFPVSALGTISVSTAKTVNTDRPFIQQNISTLASTSYVLSTRVISSSGTMKLGDLCAWASLPTGATQAYYRNGVLTTASAVEVLVYGDVISSVLTVSTTAGTAQARVGLGSAGDTSVTGSCSLTMPMVEQASTPGSYIPTTTAQVTRAADVATVNTLSPWYSATDGAIVVKGSIASMGVSNRYLASIRTPGTLNNRADIFLNSIGATQFRVVSSGTVQLAAQADNLTAKAFALTWGVGKLGQGAAGGVTSSSALIGSSPTVSQLGVGCGPLLNEFANGVISSIAYYPQIIDVQQASA